MGRYAVGRCAMLELGGLPLDAQLGGRGAWLRDLFGGDTAVADDAVLPTRIGLLDGCGNGLERAGCSLKSRLAGAWLVVAVTEFDRLGCRRGVLGTGAGMGCGQLDKKEAGR